MASVFVLLHLPPLALRLRLSLCGVWAKVGSWGCVVSDVSRCFRRKPRSLVTIRLEKCNVPTPPSAAQSGPYSPISFAEMQSKGLDSLCRCLLAFLKVS
ncbi:hypothetical protein FB451DRAFT_1240843 [Mycena latifolia]|nr:hypothetical protein FB451DRAFT_1240843 [Mycena latifolia]